MAYTVQIADSVEAYIENFKGLSDVAKRGILANVRAMLGSDGDTYRSDPTLRTGQESFQFWLTLSIFDAEMGRAHRFRFLVSDEHAVYGILAVDFVDTGGPTGSSGF